MTIISKNCFTHCAEFGTPYQGFKEICGRILCFDCYKKA